MFFDKMRIRSRATVMLAAGAVALGGCKIETVTDLTEDRPILKMVLGPGDAVLPSGSVSLSNIVISGFDFTVPDAFARGTGITGNYRPVDNPFGASNAFDMGNAVRNNTQDPRLPALVPSSAAIGDFWGMFNPGFTGQGPGSWDLFGEVTGLKPNATYTVVLARMWLKVNGELDQNQKLVGRTVTAPDELAYLGGAEDGYPGITCNFSAFSDVTADTNPVALGVVFTDDEGNATVDCIVRSTQGNSPWALDDSGFTPGNAPFGSNAVGASLAPGQFNYVLLVEGQGTDADPVPNVNPTVRVQVGPDIDASGNVINNALAPFPAAVASNPTTLPGGANAFSAPGRLALSVRGLPNLGSGRYQLWLYSRDNGSYTAAPATVTVGDETTVGASFGSPGSQAAVAAVLDDVTGVDFGSYSHVLLTVESGQATQPSDARFLYQEYLTASKNLQSGAMRFGSFAPGGTSTTFQVLGSGTGSFVDDKLIVNLRRLAQAPSGFRYQSYLVDFQGPRVLSSVSVNTVALDALGNGQDVIQASAIGGNFAAYNTYVIVLEPTAAPTLTDMRVQVSEDYRGKFATFFSQ